MNRNLALRNALYTTEAEHVSIVRLFQYAQAADTHGSRVHECLLALKDSPARLPPEVLPALPPATTQDLLIAVQLVTNHYRGLSELGYATHFNWLEAVRRAGERSGRLQEN